jgi:hypothetical protein
MLETLYRFHSDTWVCTKNWNHFFLTITGNNYNKTKESGRVIMEMKHIMLAS